MNRIYKYVLILILFILQTTFALANEVTKVEVQINTIGIPEIHFVLTFSETIDIRKAADRHVQEKYLFKLRRVSDNSILYNSTLNDFMPRDKRLDLIISNPDKDLVDLIFKKDIPVYIELEKDIVLDMPNNAPEFILTKDEVIELTKKAFFLTDYQKNMIIEASGGETFLLTNHFDISQQVNSEDDEEKEYVLNFDFSKKLPINIGKSASAFLRSKGIVSTNKENPLNKIEFYSQLNIPKINLNCEVGALSNQDFTNNSLRFNLHVQGLIPNLIDLTNGAERLRLKPYLKCGIQFVKNDSKVNPFMNKDFNLELYANGYYYIPVMDKLALILEGEAYYSDNFKIGKKFRFLYTLRFGYDLPLKDIKVLFAVQGGENDITIYRDTRVLLGLLVDFIPF